MAYGISRGHKFQASKIETTLRAILGDDLYFNFVERLGGTRCYIPLPAAKDNLFPGMNPALELPKVLAGTTIPKSARKADRLRNLGFSESFIVTLCERFGGMHVQAPPRLSEVLKGVGLTEDHISQLSDLYGGSYLNVPLSIEFRALRLRAEGLSNAKVASRLCRAEAAINQVFYRHKLKSQFAENDNRPALRADNDDKPKRRLIRAAGDE